MKAAENTGLKRQENDIVDGLTKMEAVTEPPTSLSDFEPKENGSHVKGNPIQKSAAQKKREKRKQRRREGSIISDAESVYSLSTFASAKYPR